MIKMLGIYILSFWYKREECQQRFTLFWSSVFTATAFGGLLASAISKMHGIRGLSNWRWIFILEGMVTVLIGIMAFFFVPDFPKKARWLTDVERNFVITRVGTNEERGGAVTSRVTLAFFMDIKNILAGISYFGEYLSFIFPENMSKKQLTSLRFIQASSSPRMVSGFRSNTSAAINPIEGRLLIRDNSLCLLCSNDNQNAWLLDRADPTTHCAPSRRRSCFPFHHRIRVRLHTSPLPLHPPRHRPHHHWPRHPADCTRLLLRPILGHLPRRHGCLFRGSYPRLLVRHEPRHFRQSSRRPHHRHRLDHKLRQHRRYCCYLLFPGQRCTRLSHRVFYLHGSHVRKHPGDCGLRVIGLERESNDKKHSQRDGRERCAVLFFLRNFFGTAKKNL